MFYVSDVCAVYICFAKVKRVNVRNLPTLLIEVQRERDIVYIPEEETL